MWFYQGKEVTADFVIGYVGFVYLITNINNGKRYIGKKLFYFTRTKKVKGRRKKTKKVSDWEDYYGSNDKLLRDVDRLGKDAFRREILHLCKTKGTCSYYECKEQMWREVLERNDYYNDQIRCRIHRSHIKK